MREQLGLYEILKQKTIDKLHYNICFDDDDFNKTISELGWWKFLLSDSEPKFDEEDTTFDEEGRTYVPVIDRSKEFKELLKQQEEQQMKIAVSTAAIMAVSSLSSLSNLANL
jgi:hypothetical protein